jgi:Rrf2 family protein
MNISKRSQYGMRAMGFLAKNYGKKTLISSKDISKTEEIPLDFLEKILTDLEKAKLVKSKKGIGGGYFLAKSPAKITAKDIVDVLEDIIPVHCGMCGRLKQCTSKNVWKKVEMSIDKTLKSITLKKIIS